MGLEIGQNDSIPARSKSALLISTKMKAKSGRPRCCRLDADLRFVVVMVAVGCPRFAVPRAGQRRAAAGADAGAIVPHAGGDLLPVGDELVAEPHDVRGAGLLLLRGALCGCGG